MFLDQGSNPCSLHRQADSYPLYHQGSPRPLVFKPAWFVSLPGKIFQCNSLKCVCLFIYNWYIMKHIIYLYQWRTSVAAVTVWLRGATPHPRSGAAADRSYPTSKVRSSGWQELPRIQGQEEGLKGVTPHPRSGAAADRSYPTTKVRSRGWKELPHNQGKEQQLQFAGAAVKRYPPSKVREIQVRW